MIRALAAAVAVAVAVAISAAAPLRAADATRGKAVFQVCATCHSLEPGEIKAGPSLAGVVGRKAGSSEVFSYSPAMRNSGLTWNEAALRRYLANPKAVVPSTKMAFAGIRDPKRLEDLIAYLERSAY